MVHTMTVETAPCLGDGKKMLQTHLKIFCVSVVCMLVSLKFMRLNHKDGVGDEAFRKFGHEDRALTKETRAAVKKPSDSTSPLVYHGRLISTQLLGTRP